MKEALSSGPQNCLVLKKITTSAVVRLLPAISSGNIHTYRTRFLRSQGRITDAYQHHASVSLKKKSSVTTDSVSYLD